MVTGLGHCLQHLLQCCPEEARDRTGLQQRCETPYAEQRREERRMTNFRDLRHFDTIEGRG